MVEEFRINPEFVPVDKADHTTQEKVIWQFTCFMFGNVLHSGRDLIKSENFCLFIFSIIYKLHFV
jgi:hypothetical protein